MPIAEKDIKRLWGLAAGRCSRPGCEAECVRFLDAGTTTLIGEMAHIIADSPVGPRGDGVGRDDSYDNLILLCPSCHTEVDKAPAGTFTAEVLREWKRSHEERVRAAFLTPIYSNRPELFKEIQRLLAENHQTWRTWGPDSPEALRNPISSASKIWSLRKLAVIVPNNRRILALLSRHPALLKSEEATLLAEFGEHAAGFEANCYERVEGAPRFPEAFDRLVQSHA